MSSQVALYAPHNMTDRELSVHTDACMRKQHKPLITANKCTQIIILLNVMFFDNIVH